MEIVVRVALGVVAVASLLLLRWREEWFAGSRVEQIGGFWTRRPAPPLRSWRHPVLYFAVVGLAWGAAVTAALGHPIVFVLVGGVLFGGGTYLFTRWLGRNDPPCTGPPEGAGTLRGAEGE